MIRSYLRLGQTVKLETLAAVFVTAAPLIYFNAALRGMITLASEDGILFNVPLRIAAANIVRDGSLPLWNPYIFSGMPLHAAAQGGLLFPLNWFYFFFDAPTATNLMTLSTYMLAALGAYLYALRSGSSFSGAVVTSLVWQWCGFLVGQFSHVNIVQTAALLPWLLWSVDGFGIRADRRRGLVLAVVVMLQAFTGHQQTLVYSLLLAAAYAVVMWRASRSKRNAYLWSLVMLAAGILLAAVQILPTYELMRNSIRSRASFDFFTAFSLPPRFLLTFFAPYLMGGGDGRLFRVNYFGAPFYGEFIGYVGLVALILAIVSVVLKRDARTKFWAAVVVVAFLLALGRHWPFKLYGIIYYVPILNLFRVPARHMMEVDLALSVLAGRGITALAAASDRRRAMRISLVIGTIVFVITLLVVTLGRPAAFRLSRDVPLTLLRAPELFLPIVIAALSVGAVWKYARSRSVGSLGLIIAVVTLDLCLWGQSSGWRVASPTPDSPIWNEGPPIKQLREQTRGAEPYRILTAHNMFDPNQEVADPLLSPTSKSVFWLQPNICMMQGVENAAGYDGFGMARYSRMAGDMAVWGELPKPDLTLRGEGRELDLLNVRYLLAMSAPSNGNESKNEDSPVTTETDVTRPPNSTLPPALGPPPASRVFDGQRFADDDLKLPSIDKDAWLTFDLPPREADRIALLTNLSWSVELADNTPVARLSLYGQDGRRFEFDLRVGEHTSEWSYDRPDIRRQVKNSRAKVATSYKVQDVQARYQGHTYLSVFHLPQRTMITGGELRVLESKVAPDLSLSLHAASLADGSEPFPLRTEWISRQVATKLGGTTASGRWLRVADVGDVTIFENTRVLPRAWLASTYQVLKENEILQVVRNGSFSNGNLWEPRRTALLEAPININPDTFEDASANATVTSHKPNRIELRTASNVPSILVLSENFFPGWHAYVDGKSTKILRVNYNLRGVVLKEGQHVVEFVYRPASILIGLAISVLTLAALIWWMLANRLNLKRH